MNRDSNLRKEHNTRITIGGIIFFSVCVVIGSIWAITDYEPSPDVVPFKTPAEQALDKMVISLDEITAKLDKIDEILKRESQ